MWGKRAVVVLVLAVSGCDGCSGEAVSESGTGSGAEAGSGVDAGTSGPDTTPVSATATTRSSSGTGSTGSASTGGASDTTWGPVPDLPPFPAECFEPSPTIVVERAQSPRGPLSFDEAWLDTDWCTHGPVVHVRDTAADQTVLCVIDDAQPLLGTYDCWVDNLGPAQTVSVEVLEPFDDPDPDFATGGVHLHARLEVTGGGWNISVEVDVPDCGEHNCYCPCE